MKRVTIKGLTHPHQQWLDTYAREVNTLIKNTSTLSKDEIKDKALRVANTLCRDALTDTDRRQVKLRSTGMAQVWRWANRQPHTNGAEDTVSQSPEDEHREEPAYMYRHLIDTYDTVPSDVVISIIWNWPNTRRLTSLKNVRDKLREEGYVLEEIEESNGKVGRPTKTWRVVSRPTPAPDPRDRITSLVQTLDKDTVTTLLELLEGLKA
jgi:hypothetical protein